MKIKAPASTIMLMLLLVAVAPLFLRLASANPVPWPSTPNQEKPTLTVLTPQNNTAIDASSIYLNFTVAKPDSWNKVYMVIPYVGQVVSVNVYLDGKGINYESYEHGNGESYSVKLNQLALGLHMLNITVLSFTYYRGPAFNDSHIVSDIVSSSGPVYEYPIVVSDIVYFTVVEPSPSLQETENQIEQQSFLTTLIVASVVSAIAVCAGLLVYFQKRK